MLDWSPINCVFHNPFLYLTNFLEQLIEFGELHMFNSFEVILPKICINKHIKEMHKKRHVGGVWSFHRACHPLRTSISSSTQKSLERSPLGFYESFITEAWLIKSLVIVFSTQSSILLPSSYTSGIELKLPPCDHSLIFLVTYPLLGNYLRNLATRELMNKQKTYSYHSGISTILSIMSGTKEEDQIHIS